MQKNNSINQNVERYVVEVPRPQKGQVISSGGIRENGKIAVQYKNPVPYKEPVSHTNNYYIQRDFRGEMKERFKYELANAALDLGSEIAFSFWDECLRPVCKDFVNDISEIIKGKCLKSKGSSDVYKIKAKEVIERKKEETDLVINENIISFPKRKIV